MFVIELKKIIKINSDRFIFYLKNIENTVHFYRHVQNIKLLLIQ